MSLFGQAKKLYLKDEAINTRKWISDDELKKMLAVTEHGAVIDQLNDLFNYNDSVDNDIKVNTNRDNNQVVTVNVKVA